MAHARLCGIFRVGEIDPARVTGAGVDWGALDQPEERELVKALLDWPTLLFHAADALEPHRVASWLLETARLVHTWYHKHHVLIDDTRVMEARLALAKAARITLANGLGLLGIAAPAGVQGAPGGVKVAAIGVVQRESMLAIGKAHVRLQMAVVPPVDVPGRANHDSRRRHAWRLGDLQALGEIDGRQGRHQEEFTEEFIRLACRDLERLVFSHGLQPFAGAVGVDEAGGVVGPDSDADGENNRRLVGGSARGTSSGAYVPIVAPAEDGAFGWIDSSSRSFSLRPSVSAGVLIT